MKPISCLRAGNLMQRRAAGLSESERLRLEEHLGVCTSCTAEAQTLSVLRELSLQAHSPLDEPTHRRLIERAFQESARKESWSRRQPVYPISGMIAVTTAAAAAWLLMIGPGQESTHENSSAVVRSEERSIDRVLSADIEAGDRILLTGQEVPSGLILESKKQGARLSLAHATVELHTNTRLQWIKRNTTVKLMSGGMRVQVEPSKSARFRVATSGFVVEVWGTRFDVTLQNVRVFEGRVRILAPDGNAVLNTLSAGDLWQLEEVTHARRKESVKRRDTATETRDPQPSAQSLLARAREQLASGQVDEAILLVKAAQTRASNRKQQAEAQSLLADCSLVQGDYSTSIQLYRAVVSRYPDLTAAENALFAAARLESKHGDKDAAHKLLMLYMKRYPQGRFQKEVSARLQNYATE